MSMIDRQRIAAVKALEAMGFTFDGVSRDSPAAVNPDLASEADALHSLLVAPRRQARGLHKAQEEETEPRVDRRHGDGLRGQALARW